VSDQSGLWNELAQGPDEVFASFLVPALFGPMADALLRIVLPRPGERVLDVAAGTGAVSSRARERVGSGGRIVGVDLSTGMLGIAGRLRSADALCGGDMGALPFRRAAFDLVLCQQGLPFAPQPERALAEMHGVLRSGGRLGVAVFGPLEECPTYAAIAEALGRFADTTAMLPPFALSDADRLVALVRGAGFADVRLVREAVDLRAPSARDFVVGLAAGGSSMRRVMAAVPEDQRRRVVESVEAALARFQGGAGLIVPQPCLFVAADAP
jgi:SAM-dependent methyltransferase